ncbi:hypothetical protein [Actinomadura sp. 3N407]|uniref:hypothetical protein n=1 Tax=Actinomadura sp. 3N407 TaxID=3457423 RepID=UPI003FCC9440
MIPRFVEHLHAAGVAGVVLPTCPICQRQVRIDKPMDGVRVCRTCIARSRVEECSRCGVLREPVTREQGRPICANCFISDPANLETCVGCGRRRRVYRRTTDGPFCQNCHALPRADLLDLRRHHPLRDLPHHRPALVPGLPAPLSPLLDLRSPRPDRRGHPDTSALR